MSVNSVERRYDKGTNAKSGSLDLYETPSFDKINSNERSKSHFEKRTIDRRHNASILDKRRYTHLEYTV